MSRNIDQERDKIAYDLAYTSYVDTLDWAERSGLPAVTRNGTGDVMYTDKKLVVLRLRDRRRPGFRPIRRKWTRFLYMGGWGSVSCGARF